MLMIERVLIRTSRQELREADNRFNQALIDKALSGMETVDVHREIAEHAFRKPVVIFDNVRIGIKPFWRDGKQAPSLPIAKSEDRYRGHH